MQKVHVKISLARKKYKQSQCISKHNKNNKLNSIIGLPLTLPKLKAVKTTESNAGKM